MPVIVEREGEVLPSYTGVNQPRYYQHEGDSLPDHNFSNGNSDETSGVPVDATPVVERPAANPYWPDQATRETGKVGVAGWREALENATPPQPKSR